MSRTQRLIFELSARAHGRDPCLPRRCPRLRWKRCSRPRPCVPKPPAFLEVSEVDVVRHFVNLSQLNHSVDNGFYPLGSCTMNITKVNEDAARLPGFARIHPDQPADTVQGPLRSG